MYRRTGPGSCRLGIDQANRPLPPRSIPRTRPSIGGMAQLGPRRDSILCSKILILCCSDLFYRLLVEQIQLGGRLEASVQVWPMPRATQAPGRTRRGHQESEKAQACLACVRTYVPTVDRVWMEQLVCTARC